MLPAARLQEFCKREYGLNAALGSACPNLPNILLQGATWECVFGPFTALDGLEEFGLGRIQHQDARDRTIMAML